MNSAMHYAHDGIYLLAFGTVGCAVFPDGAIIEDGEPPGWPIGACPSARHRWNILTCTWDEMPLSVEEAWAQARFKRDELLAACDWRASAAAESGIPLAAEWRAYRQALRDITAQSNVFKIVWPSSPS